MYGVNEPTMLSKMSQHGISLDETYLSSICSQIKTKIYILERLSRFCFVSQNALLLVSDNYKHLEIRVLWRRSKNPYKRSMAKRGVLWRVRGSLDS